MSTGSGFTLAEWLARNTSAVPALPATPMAALPSTLTPTPVPLALATKPTAKKTATAMLDAVFNDDLTKLSALLESKPNVNSILTTRHAPVSISIHDLRRDMFGGSALPCSTPPAPALRSLLLIAIEKNNLAMVTLLLEHGANVNQRYSRSGMRSKPPLRRAIEVGNCAMVRLLLDYKASVHDDSCKRSMMHYAFGAPGHLQLLELLLERNASVDSLPLDVPYSKGDRHVMELLLQHKADSNSAFAQLPLHCAIQNHDRSTVELLLQHKADINLRNASEQVALTVAAMHDDCEMMEFLIAKQCQALDEALQAVALRGSVRVAALLLDHRANVDCREAHSSNTPLINASMRLSQSAVLELLVEHGANVNATNACNVSALHNAALIGNHAAVELLLHRQADISSVTASHESVLHCAIRSGDHRLIELLLENRSDVNACGVQHNTPLHAALIEHSNDTKIIELLVTYEAEVMRTNASGNTPLHVALCCNAPNASVDLLLHHRADVNTNNQDGATPFEIAIDRNNSSAVERMLQCSADIGHDAHAPHFWDRSPIAVAACHADSTILKLLFECNASLPCVQGEIPVFHEGNMHNLHTVALLIEHRASVNVLRDTYMPQGSTPLHIAAADAQLTTLLLENNADPHAINQQHQTPLQCAIDCANVQVVEALLHHNADPSGVEQKATPPLHSAVLHKSELVELLLSQRANVNQTDMQALQTPLHIAVRHSTDTTACLLSHNAQVDAVDSVGCTAAFYAKPDALELLLRAKASPNTTHALHELSLIEHACTHSCTEAVAVLLRHRANVNGRNSKGDTPLHIAAAVGNPGVITLLLDHGALRHAANVCRWQVVVRCDLIGLVAPWCCE
jgi:ankyrin repeat protein